MNTNTLPGASSNALNYLSQSTNKCLIKHSHKDWRGVTAVTLMLLLSYTPSASSVCSPAAGAQGCTVSVDPTSAPGYPVPSSLVGNPINYANGNKYQRDVDFTTQHGQFSLVRHYNSLNSQSVSRLGHGWHATFTVSLHKSSASIIRIIQGNGRLLTFMRDSADDSRFSTVNPSDGIIIESSSTRRWLLPGGRELSFRGPLVTSTRWVTNDTIHTLEYFYRHEKLDQMTYRSTLSNEEQTQHTTFRFEYYNADHGRTGVSPSSTEHLPALLKRIYVSPVDYLEYHYSDSQLISVKRNNLVIRNYHYGVAEHHRLLTGISDSEGKRVSSYNYDNNRRAIKSTNYKNNRSISLEYLSEKPESGTSLSDSARVSTRVIDSSGQSAVYTYSPNVHSGRPQLITSAVTLCSQCQTTRLAYTYTKQGNLATVKRLATSGQSGAKLPADPVAVSDIPGLADIVTAALTKTTRRSDTDSRKLVTIRPSSFGTTHTLSDGINTIRWSDFDPSTLHDHDRLVTDSLLKKLHLSSRQQSANQCLSTITTVVDPETLPQLEIETETETDCDSDDVNSETGLQSHTTFPQAMFRDARAAGCHSYFDVFQGTRRGFEIEAGFADHEDFADASPTLRNFPVVDFIRDRTAIAVVSLDLRSQSYSAGSRHLFRTLLQHAQGMQERFLQPLLDHGEVSASHSGVETTITSSDVHSLVFELIIQRGVASQQQQQHILDAQREISDRYSLELKVVEIP